MPVDSSWHPQSGLDRDANESVASDMLAGLLDEQPVEFAQTHARVEHALLMNVCYDPFVVVVSLALMSQPLLVRLFAQTCLLVQLPHTP